MTASQFSTRRDLTTGGAIGRVRRRARTRIAVVWDGRWLSSCQRLSAVRAACRSLDLACRERLNGRYDGRELFPQGREHLELGPPVGRGSRGLMPLAARHTAISPMRACRVGSRCSPDWLGVTLAGVILNLVGKVGDQLRSLCQIGVPDGMVMKRLWNPGKPGQRTWAGRREFWEAPVEDGGHVARGVEVASAAAVSRWRSGCCPVSAANASRCARRVGQAGSVVSPGTYWSAWSSSATVWGPRSCSAATWRPSV